MKVRVAINGFGRIGRSVFRTAFGRPGIEIAAINEIADINCVAHLLKYDSVFGRFGSDVASEDGLILVDGVKVPVFHEPLVPDWGSLGVDVVIECTGRMTLRADAIRHIEKGAGRVLISAQSPDPDFTLVIGVNDGDMNPSSHKIVSNASCTTNCIAPVIDTIDRKYGISKARVTTIHSYTNEQNLLDNPAADLRKARAGALSMVPNGSGAAQSLIKVMPRFTGKITAANVRVPTPAVSIADITFMTQKSATPEEINRELKKASEGRLKGIMGYSSEPLVSSDYTGCPMSGVVDANQTQTVKGQLGRVLVWYDNEWGYANRLTEAALMLGQSARI